MRGAAAYAKTRNETASKERLMALLFETALKHMRVAAKALSQGPSGEAVTAITKACDIVAELRATLDHEKAPELCGQLADTYLFVCQRLIASVASQKPDGVIDAERVFAPIAEAFSEAVGQLNLQEANP